MSFFDSVLFVRVMFYDNVLFVRVILYDSVWFYLLFFMTGYCFYLLWFVFSASTFVSVGHRLTQVNLTSSTHLQGETESRQK